MAPDGERAGLTANADDQERNLFLARLNKDPMCKIKTSQPLTEPDQHRPFSPRTEFTAAQTHQRQLPLSPDFPTQLSSLFLQMEVNEVVWEQP